MYGRDREPQRSFKRIAVHASGARSVLDIIGRGLTLVFVVGILVSAGRKVGAGSALYPSVAVAVVGALLLAAHQWLSRRGDKPRQVLPGLGVLALAASIVFLAAAHFPTTKSHPKPRLTASAPVIVGEYAQAPDPKPNPRPKSQPSSEAPKAPPPSQVTRDLSAEAGSSPACPSCIQGRYSQPGKAPGGGGGSTPHPHETQASTAKAKEESADVLSTKTETPGGGGSAEVKGGSSSSGEISGSAGSIKSESKSSSSTSSTSTENGSTQSAQTQSTSERKTESNTAGVPTG